MKVRWLWGIRENDNRIMDRRLGSLTSHAYFTKKEALEELKNCNQIGCFPDGAHIVKLVPIEV